MTAVATARVPLLDATGREHGAFTVHVLPGSAKPAHSVAPLLDMRGAADRDVTVAPVQLLEGTEYRYEIDVDSNGVIETDRAELFAPDDSTGRTGRFRPGLHVGLLPLSIRLNGVAVGHCTLEVRAHKLDYLSQYRWMLRDIADMTAEVLMERFGASEQRFAIDEHADARTLYQRFVFLKSLLADEELVAALWSVVERPYVSWEEFENPSRSTGHLRPGSRIGRAFTRPGPRSRLNTNARFSGVDSLPALLPRVESRETVDNPPNQFVRFALTSWCDTLRRLLRALENEPVSAPQARGVAEVSEVLGQLEVFLGSSVFRDVSDLQLLPLSNSVLQNREGYREILRAFLLSQFSAQLTWDAGDDVYGAGQRNVAVLYEYWAFLQLVEALDRISDVPLDRSALFGVQDSGVNLQLWRGRSTAVNGFVHRLGRRIDFTLYFNRSFSRSTDIGSSWGRTMRPDYSIHLRPTKGYSSGSEDIWLHFDAKYRIDRLADVLSLGAEAEDGTGETRRAKRDDLLIMHAYRDAIRRSAGAYVLYPGDQTESWAEYHELLPGLGAFGLRPTATGPAIGAGDVGRFLSDVLDHVASQVTQHERARYWERTSYSPRPEREQLGPSVDFLRRPPADTSVLLGYVKSSAHREWILRTGLYNLRADRRAGSVTMGSPELSADLLVLFGPDAADATILVLEPQVVVLSRRQMIELNYPDPGGEFYLCVKIGARIPRSNDLPLSRRDVEHVWRAHMHGPAVGTPVVVRWDRLA